MSLLINAYCTHRNPPPLSFPNTLSSRRDRSDPDLEEHLNGFIGYITQGGEREMTQALYHVYRHLERVQHHLSLEVEDDHLDQFATWAWEANAVVFLPDGSVCDPSGNVLVDSDDGSCHDDAQIPHPLDAIERKERHDEQLYAQGIPVAATLPPVVGECEVVLRAADEVARRTRALFAVALRAEGIATDEEVSVESIRDRLPVAFESFTPVEADFMNTPVPNRQSVINHAWRYECLFVLQWALGHFDELHFPSQICDVPLVARATLDRESQALLAEAILRPTSDILDAVDLHMRLHWAARQANRDEKSPPAELDLGVLQERRHALNWLIHFEYADWDDVECPHVMGVSNAMRIIHRFAAVRGKSRASCEETLDATRH